MYPLGHTGIAVAVVRALRAGAPVGAVALASLLPDLIDKPILLLFPDFARGWSRLIGHSLAGFAVFSAIAAACLRARAAPLVLGYGIHIALDLHFLETPIFLWPAYGWVPPPHPKPYWDRFFQKFGDPYTIGGELVGLAIWVRLGLTWRRERQARPGAGEAPSAAASGTPPSPPPPRAGGG